MTLLNLHTCSQYNVCTNDSKSSGFVAAVAAARSIVMPTSNVLRWNASSHRLNIALRVPVLLFASAKYLPYVRFSEHLPTPA